MLEAKSLRMALIPSSLLPNPSPGNLQSTRLAFHVDDRAAVCSVSVASGCRIYKIEVVNSSLVDPCPHRSEIQSVVLAEEDGDQGDELGTWEGVDGSTKGAEEVDCRRDPAAQEDDELVQVAGQSSLRRMAGSNLGLCSSAFGHSVKRRGRARVDGGVDGRGAGCSSENEGEDEDVKEIGEGVVDFVERKEEERGVVGLWYPTSASFVQSSLSTDESYILVVSEASQLSAWDLRTNSNGRCIHRVCGAVGDLIYAVCSCPSGPIAAGGSDRTVTIYDPRSVQCKENNRRFAFRGDTNWLGFNKCANKDVLVDGANLVVYFWVTSKSRTPCECISN